MGNASRRQPFQIRSIAIDHIDMALPFTGRAEHQMPPIRGPGWRIVHSMTGSQSNAFLPIRADEAELVLTLFRAADMSDPIAARGPGGRGIIIAFIGQTPYIRAVGAHYVELRPASAIRRKHNFTAG